MSAVSTNCCFMVGLYIVHLNNTTVTRVSWPCIVPDRLPGSEKNVKDVGGEFKPNLACSWRLGSTAASLFSVP